MAAPYHARALIHPVAPHRRAIMSRRFAVVLLRARAAPVAAQETPLPPPAKQPLLRFDPAGPSAPVTALAFNKQGTRLYAGGMDKVVRVWERQGDDWKLVHTFRLPV